MRSVFVRSSKDARHESPGIYLFNANRNMTVILCNSELAIYEVLMGHCHKASRSMSNCNSNRFCPCSEVHACNSQCIFQKWAHYSHFADVERASPVASALPEQNSWWRRCEEAVQLCAEQKTRKVAVAFPAAGIPQSCSHTHFLTWTEKLGLPAPIIYPLTLD